jgi:aryl-alcohol dehydrogenase-like predicted oxidoreductase
MIVATKVGMHPKFSGLSPATIRTAAEESLRRLQTDYIDLYYAHQDDENTPLEETLSAFDQLVQDGKVRYVAASNYSAARLQEALSTANRGDFVRYVAVQQHYNLVERDKYEGELANVVAREGLSCIPYFALASGFLTGKYRPGAKVNSQRAERAGAYLNEKGIKILGRGCGRAWRLSRFGGSSLADCSTHRGGAGCQCAQSGTVARSLAGSRSEAKQKRNRSIV